MANGAYLYPIRVDSNVSNSRLGVESSGHKRVNSRREGFECITDVVSYSGLRGSLWLAIRAVVTKFSKSRVVRYVTFLLDRVIDDKSMGGGTTNTRALHEDGHKVRQ